MEIDRNGLEGNGKDCPGGGGREDEIGITSLVPVHT